MPMHWRYNIYSNKTSGTDYIQRAVQISAYMEELFTMIIYCDYDLPAPALV